MKNLILTSLILLSSMFCFSQNIYQVKVNHLEIGNYITDTTSTWLDSILVVEPTILIYKDSLVVKNEYGENTYKFSSSREVNPNVSSFFSIQENTNKPYIVSFFTSPCVDNVSITIIIEDDEKSYNYYGKIK